MARDRRAAGVGTVGRTAGRRAATFATGAAGEAGVLAGALADAAFGAAVLAAAALPETTLVGAVFAASFLRIADFAGAALADAALAEEVVTDDAFLPARTIVELVAGAALPALCRAVAAPAAAVLPPVTRVDGGLAAEGGRAAAIREGAAAFGAAVLAGAVRAFCGVAEAAPFLAAEDVVCFLPAGGFAVVFADVSVADFDAADFALAVVPRVEVVLAIVSFPSELSIGNSIGAMPPLFQVPTKLIADGLPT
jgi:hypothetical protein